MLHNIEYECAFPFDEETVEDILAAEDQIVFALHQEGELHDCPEMGVEAAFDNFLVDDYYFKPRPAPYRQHINDYIAITIARKIRMYSYVPSVNAHPDPDYNVAFA